MRRSSRQRVAVALALLVLAVWMGILVWLRSPRPPGTTETDRIASVVASAVLYPRPQSADQYLQAVLSKPAAQDGRLSVVQAERLPATRLDEPFVRMVWRVYLRGSESGWTKTDPVTACYEVAFSFYSATLGPRRIMCLPSDPITVVPESSVEQPIFPQQDNLPRPNN